MAMTQTQIDEAFAAMGLAPPSSAVLAALEAIPDTYTALATIIQLPQVQTSVTPIVTMFDLALGHDPTSATLSSMVSSNLSQAQLASDFVSSQAFANVYNGGVLLNPNTVVTTANESIITALFVNGLGHPPTPATLSGFLGLTLSQAFLEFSQSQAAGISPIVDTSLTQILELATGISPQSNPPTPQDFTLTVGQDSVISGQNTVATTTPGVLVQSIGAVTVNAPLTGVFGNQPTLTSADVIQLAGTGNSLNAGFDGTDILPVMTIQGVQALTITQTGLGGTVLIAGTPGSIDGVTSLTYNGNGLLPTTMELGVPGEGIDKTTEANGFNLTVANSPGAPGTGVAVVFASTAFTGGEQINVTANGIGNVGGGTSHTAAAAEIIEAGTGGANGFAIWSVTSENANALNDIALNAEGSTKATTLNVIDDGSATWIWAGGDPADWAGLTTINAGLTTGNLTVTGHENGPDGILADDTTALTSVIGGAGADTFDLSAYAGSTAQVAGLSIAGGANTTIELSNSEINKISVVAANAFAQWTSVAVLDDVASPGLGGAVNMADFPGTGTLSFLSSTSGTSGAFFTSNLNVTNGPANFLVQFNEQNWDAATIAISGAAGGNTLTMDLSDVGVPTSVTTNGYPIVDLVVPHNSTIVFGSPYDTTFTDNTSGATPTLNISDAAGATAANADDVLLGNIGFFAPTTAVIGVSTVSINDASATSTTINADNIGRLLLGATNVTNINAQGTAHLVMDAPDTGGGVEGTQFNNDNPFLFHGVDVFGSNNGDNLLQGSSGPLTLDTAGNGYIGGVAADTINAGTHGGDSIFGEGGNDIINLAGAAHASDTVYIGTYDVSDTAPASPGTTFHQAITDIVGGIEIGANFYDGTLHNITTVNGFVNGATGDQINFSVGDWATGTLNGPGHDYGLLAASGAPIMAGASTMQLVTAPGTAVPTAEVVLDGITTYANASQLQSQLAIGTVGDIELAPTGVLGAHDIFHVLMAYSTGTQIDIADVSITNTSGAAITGIDTAKAGLSITVHDLVDITGMSNLGLLNPHDFTFTS